MGTQHLRVPLGLIRALCYPGGTRLPQRVSKARPSEIEGDAVTIPVVYASAVSYVPVVMPESFRNPGLDVMGNLSNEAYKFFKGSAIKVSHYFQCRGCFVEAYVKEQKLQHMRECRPLMQAIEERVRRDKVCVICNLSTDKSRWQIPLCSETCISKWRFQMPVPWITARRFVLAADPSLLRFKCVSTPINS